MKKPVARVAVTLALFAAWGCGKRVSADSPPGPGHSALPDRALQENVTGFRYPPGTWRLSSFEELDRTTLWLGHIAIRHNESQVEEFRPPSWRPDSPNPARSPAEALALAEAVWRKVAMAPDSFEQLAHLYSEDVVTKDDGGRLGGVRASQLVSSDFLDVLATLKPGEVSRPFRTPYGFHILKRYAPPPEQQLAGERIVIGYRGTFGLVAESPRTREQALDLARQVAEQARKSPATFGALVARHSENVDRANQGRMGVYSTRDPGYLPVEIAHLADMKMGEVSAPLDSRLGFQIIKRVPPVPGTTYAMAAIELTFDPAAGDRDSAKADTLQKARSLLRDLVATPDRFEEFQGTYCCDRIQRWSSDRGDIQLTAALDRVRPGRIAPEPLLRPGGYMIIKRLDPRALPPEPPRLFEVPRRTEPDYESILKNTDGARIAAAARAFGGVVRGTPAFSQASVKTIVETIDHVASYLEQNQADPLATRGTVLSAMASLEGQLDGTQFKQLTSLGRHWIIRQMMPSDAVE